MASPDFTEVFLRVDRAARHRGEINDLAFAHHQAKPIEIYTEYVRGSLRVFAQAAQPFPPDIALAFSDWAHQLRAALDATLYQVAVADSGQSPPPGDDQLQYPLTTTPEQFEKVARRRLKHLSARSVTEIGRTQPYNIPTGARGHALWWLHEMARLDRHRIAHEFAWHIRGVEFGGFVENGARIEHADQQLSFVRSHRRAFLGAITPGPDADLSPGLDVKVHPIPEIPRWLVGSVASYRFSLSERMEGIEDVIRRTAEYFRDRA